MKWLILIFICHRGEWIIDHFEETPIPMPTYLLAFAWADFDYVDNKTSTGLKEKYVSGVVITCFYQNVYFKFACTLFPRCVCLYKFGIIIILLYFRSGSGLLLMQRKQVSWIMQMK